MRNWKTLLASVVLRPSGFRHRALAQDAAAPPITDLPRNETLIINNPENPEASPDNFNMWVAGNGAGWSNGLHQLNLDTLWFIDPEAGLKRRGARPTTSWRPAPPSTIRTSPK